MEKVPVPCKEIPCRPHPLCKQQPCSPPPAGPCYEDTDCYRPPKPKPVKPWSKKRCDDDQCPPPPPVFLAQLRQCDVHGVILHFDGTGLLRDQLNRIGYIADNF